MSYALDDVTRLRLSEELIAPFCKELALSLDKERHFPSAPSTDDYYIFIRNLISWETDLEDYVNTVEYQLAGTAVERAKIAINAKTIDKSNGKILELWLKYANQMTDFEKVMAGWDKL